MSTTKTQADKTATNAKATARSASDTAHTATRNASATTRRQARATEQGVVKHTRRVTGAAQREVQAVLAQPYRPALFALGVVDRFAGGVRALPQALASTPTRARAGVVGVAATAGDLAEQAQRGYTEVAKDGERLVRAIRRQESTQRAVTFAERAQSRTEKAVSDAGKAVEAGAEATQDALRQLG